MLTNNNEILISELNRFIGEELNLVNVKVVFFSFTTNGIDHHTYRANVVMKSESFLELTLETYKKISAKVYHLCKKDIPDSVCLLLNDTFYTLDHEDELQAYAHPAGDHPTRKLGYKEALKNHLQDRYENNQSSFFSYGNTDEFREKQVKNAPNIKLDEKIIEDYFPQEYSDSEMP